MGKASKWIKSFIGGKKDKVDKEKEKNTSSTSTATTATTTTTNKVVIPPPQSTPKEKKRWSFRRSSATAPKDSSSNESTPTKPAPVATSPSPSPDQHDEPKKADLTILPPEHSADIAESEEAEKAIFALEAAAATKIQSIFRSYLARKALRALRGLVKIQALVRGHLVRKQATVTLRCMQALVTAQARARAHRIKNQDFNSSYHDFESGMMEENVKIVEMDQGGESHTKNNYSNYHYPPHFDYTKQDYHKFSPAPSAITDISPRTCSGHFEDYTYATAQSSPQCYYSAVSRPDPSKTPFAFPSQDYPESLSYDYPLYPNYMANTKSSRAKARSQSAPKQRPETFERQLSKRRPSVEGRNIPRAVRMQRSSSHVGATAQGYQYPCSVRLDKSTVSLIESECGSNCSAFTNANYCRTVISYDPQGNRY